MLDFQIPRITSESVEQNRGTFTIEPLDRGFGYTFGNSLRRVLLSSLAGAAVTSVRIEGVAHEFSTIHGRQGGRHRHRPEPQGRGLPDALRRQRGRGAAGRHRPGRDHRQGHRPARRRRDPQPRPAHRDAREENQARAVHDDRPRPRLPPGRGEQVLRPADRRDPDRLDLLARAPRRLRRRAGARRPEDRLRQAHARHRDRRLDRPPGRAARGRRAADLASSRSSPTPTASRSCARRPAASSTATASPSAAALRRRCRARSAAS